jgi:hypothetical protein
MRTSKTQQTMTLATRGLSQTNKTLIGQKKTVTNIISLAAVLLRLHSGGCSAEEQGGSPFQISLHGKTNDGIPNMPSL